MAQRSKNFCAAFLKAAAFFLPYAVAAPSGGGYIQSMRWISCLLFLGLAACSLPGRQTFAAKPAGADTASIAATQAFSGRLPLVTILPGAQDFAGPVQNAVKQALAIKPTAQFEVQAQTPVAPSPDQSATALSGLAATATDVAKAIVADGVPDKNVTLTARTAGLDAAVLVYVK
jgi:hypothetical protein